MKEPQSVPQLPLPKRLAISPFCGSIFPRHPRHLLIQTLIFWEAFSYIQMSKSKLKAQSQVHGLM